MLSSTYIAGLQAEDDITIDFLSWTRVSLLCMALARATRRLTLRPRNSRISTADFLVLVSRVSASES